MQLPGRLSQTTLGDLLGRLCRERVSGILELCAAHGAVHRVHLRDGLVVGVELAAPKNRRAAVIDCRDRLDVLFSLRDASIRFRVARPLGQGALSVPLAPAEFLYGRPRARSRAQERSGDREPAKLREEARRIVRVRALATLGLTGPAGVADVTRAFRKLARELHPDRHGASSAAEYAHAVRRFAEVSAAYHTLVA